MSARTSPEVDDPFHGVSPLLRRYLARIDQGKIAHRFCDVLVLGSGVAGLSAALAAAEESAVDVLVVSKSDLDDSATRWAQGGVAAVIAPERTGDSPERHVADTLAGAAGLANREAVELTVREGVERVRALIRLGAEFDRNAEGGIQMTREGAHSFPRILHRGDTTGQEIERALLANVQGRGNIRCLAHTYAIDLLTAEETCQGALVRDRHGEIQAVWARRTVLATGGAGRLYRETTNPAVCTGDGIAMAFRAGATLRDLEFVQFHPTTLYVAGADRHLITEAVRGEGGRLVDDEGQPFMERFHPLADLAPRDVVSRSILAVMKQQGTNRVWLDFSRIPPERVRERFPRIQDLCRGFGFDILEEPIPVRPSAHYSIGGVATDLEARTDLPGLFAAGEVASTGVHGANRLGSNSLLEGLVFGHRAGELAAREAVRSRAARPRVALPVPLDDSAASKTTEPSREALDLEDLATSLKSLIWYRVGVERDAEGLTSALSQIRSWMTLPLTCHFDDPRSWSLQNMLQTAYLLTLSARRREESRGVHFRSDYPDRDDAHWLRSLNLSRADFSRS